MSCSRLDIGVSHTRVEYASCNRRPPGSLSRPLTLPLIPTVQSKPTTSGPSRHTSTCQVRLHYNDLWRYTDIQVRRHVHHLVSSIPRSPYSNPNTVHAKHQEGHPPRTTRLAQSPATTSTRPYASSAISESLTRWTSSVMRVGDIRSLD